jgi:hypothetical protein
MAEIFDQLPGSLPPKNLMGLIIAKMPAPHRPEERR